MIKVIFHYSCKTRSSLTKSKWQVLLIKTGVTFKRFRVGKGRYYLSCDVRLRKFLTLDTRIFHHKLDLVIDVKWKYSAIHTR